MDANKVYTCEQCGKKLCARWPDQEPYHTTCNCDSTDLFFCQNHAPEPGEHPRRVCCDYVEGFADEEDE